MTNDQVVFTLEAVAGRIEAASEVIAERLDGIVAVLGKIASRLERIQEEIAEIPPHGGG